MAFTKDCNIMVLFLKDMKLFCYWLCYLSQQQYSILSGAVIVYDPVAQRGFAIRASETPCAGGTAGAIARPETH